MIISLDIAYTHNDLFRKFLTEHDIPILEYIEIGPAGGNPYYSIQLDTPELLIAFTDFYVNS
jgi:hypothetical protein